MKKLVLILALMIIPCAAFGMEMLNDNTMDGITGQAGVSIAFDDIQLFINVEKMAYIDCDGFNTLEGYNCTGAGGALYLDNFQIDVLNVNAIVKSGLGNGQVGPNMGLQSCACGDIPLFFNYATNTPLTSCYLGTAAGGDTGAESLGLEHYTSINSVTGATNRFQAQALSIDVTDALPVLTEGWQANYAGATGVGTELAIFGVGGVLISLPTLEVSINNLTFTPKYTGYINAVTSSAANDAVNAASLGIQSNFGTIEFDGITFTVLSGWMEIAPH